MAVTINANTSNGVVITPDISGEIELQANGVTKAKITSSGLTDSSGSIISKYAGPKNRIINGDMRISQRYVGNTTTTTNGYTLDRFYFYTDVAGVSTTVQQVSDAPTGFSASLKLTAVTGATAGTGQQSVLGQAIEGYNVVDFNFGTASAKTITISFWVKSSLTGTFAGNLENATPNRDYVFNYTISSANTWEYKTVTISGDTTGTWATANTRGLYVLFNMGSNQSSFAGTPNTWSSSIFRTTTGAVELLQTTGATWQMTGLQVEEGTQATEFERLPYDMQLQRCLRYYEKSFPYTSQPAHGIDNRFVPHSGSAGCGGNTYTSERFRVEKRVNPTLRIFDCNGAGTFSTNLARVFTACNAGTQVSTLAFGANTTLLSGYVQGGTDVTLGFNFTAEAEL